MKFGQVRRGPTGWLTQYRAAMELAHEALPHSAVVRNILPHGGDAVRGRNEDQHITGWNASRGEILRSERRTRETMRSGGDARWG